MVDLVSEEPNEYGIDNGRNTKVVHSNHPGLQNVPTNTTSLQSDPSTNVRDQPWEPSTVDHVYVPPSAAICTSMLSTATASCTGPIWFLKLEVKLHPREGECSGPELDLVSRTTSDFIHPTVSLSLVSVCLCSLFTPFAA